MEEHVQTLHGKSSFICRTCNHVFTEEEDYNVHVSMHDKQENSTEETKDETEKLNDQFQVVSEETDEKQGILDENNEKLEESNRKQVESEEKDEFLEETTDELQEVENHNTHVEIHEGVAVIQGMKDEEVNLLENIMYNFILEGFISNDSETKAEIDEEDINQNKCEDIDDKTQNKTESTEEDNKGNRCENCEYIARNEAWLVTHRKTMHGGNTVPHTYFDELIELTCRQCVYEGKNEDEIDIHMMHPQTIPEPMQLM